MVQTCFFCYSIMTILPSKAKKNSLDEGFFVILKINNWVTTMSLKVKNSRWSHGSKTHNDFDAGFLTTWSHGSKTLKVVRPWGVKNRLLNIPVHTLQIWASLEASNVG
jgi:hypothetical protein